MKVSKSPSSQFTSKEALTVRIRNCRSSELNEFAECALTDIFTSPGGFAPVNGY
jgi:hypothetical protein